MEFKETRVHHLSDTYMLIDRDALFSGTSIEGIGMIAAFGISGTKEGYLQCNGCAVSRETYSDLYSVIGTKYGVGDGTSTFTLPTISACSTDMSACETWYIRYKSIAAGPIGSAGQKGDDGAAGGAGADGADGADGVDGIDASSTNLSEASDVGPITPSAGDVLVFDGTVWSSTSLNDHTTSTALHFAYSSCISATTDLNSHITSTALHFLFSSVTASDYKAKVTLADTTPDYLFSKLDSGVDVNLTIENSGADESIKINLVRAAAIRTFYFDNSAADVAGYKRLDAVYYSATTFDVCATVASGSTTIEEFITDTGYPNVSFIGPGSTVVHFHAKKTAGGTKDVNVYFDIYSRDTSGSETLLGTTSYILVDTLVTEKYDVTLTLVETQVDPDRRIVVKIKADPVGAGGDPVIVFYMEGDTSSRLVLPTTAFDFKHNSLNTLQGGVADEYYHLSEENYSAVCALSAHYADTAAHFLYSSTISATTDLNVHITDTTVHFLYSSCISATTDLNTHVTSTALHFAYSSISAGLGAITGGALYGMLNKSGAYSIEASEVRNNYLSTNISSSVDIVLTLPAASAGMFIPVINTEGKNITIAAQSADSINSPTLNGVSAVISSSTGNITLLYSVDDTRWFMFTQGTWTSVVSRVLWGGGYNSVPLNYIQYNNPAAAGNAADFGDLSEGRRFLAACGGQTRAVWSNGFTTSSVITQEYVEFSTLGNVTNFGDCLYDIESLAGLGNTTRGVFAGGDAAGAQNYISYITIATVGSSLDFGDLSQARLGCAGCSSNTRGTIWGGEGVGIYDTIDYITLASTGNASDFGNMTNTMEYRGCSSSATRGIGGGGWSGSAENTIDYITLASTGNASDFGDLTVSRRLLASASNATRSLFAGGGTSPIENTIDYIEIASTGNASDFGDLNWSSRDLSGCSNGHGGVL